jgi:ribosomal protein S18 acetylase RimI-like enzyme
VEQRARSRGAERLVLQVNKQNAAAIAFYQRQSFTIREAAVFDIGNGFVMDDYVMEKPLGRSQLAE